MTSIPHVLEGKLNANGLKIGIVCARFNSIFVEQLLSGAEDALIRHGAAPEDITVAWVPIFTSSTVSPFTAGRVGGGASISGPEPPMFRSASFSSRRASARLSFTCCQSSRS